MRLGNEGGKLVMDEGDIVEEPNQYRRSKRIAHAKDYDSYLSDKYEYLQNGVNVDTLAEDLIPSQSETDFVGIQGMLQTGTLDPAGYSAQDMAMAQMYERDSSFCLQKYLCEIAGTSPSNLLMEEAALLAMVRSQHEITALLRSNEPGPYGSRPRRSAIDIDSAMAEARIVQKTCNQRFPHCSISRMDILRVYKDQKDSFCSLPMPYGL